VTFPGPSDPCPHEELREGMDGRWILCNRCHRLVISDRVADVVAAAVLAGERFTLELVLRKVREQMDAWTPEYYLETDDVTPRSP
jgi:hypothetical protein